MRKILFGLIMGMFMFCGFSSISMAQDTAQKYGVYVAPRVMMDVIQANYMNYISADEGGVQKQDVKVGGALAVGYNFNTNFDVPVRAELEYAIRSTANFDFDDRTIRARVPQSLFANFYLDFVNSTDFTPYVGGGVGLGFVGSDTNFAWNVGGGLAYNLTEDWKVNVGYRYVSLGEFEDRHVSGMYNAHEIYTGVQYEF